MERYNFIIYCVEYAPLLKTIITSCILEGYIIHYRYGLYIEER